MNANFADNDNPYAAPDLDTNSDPYRRNASSVSAADRFGQVPSHPVIFGYVAWVFGIFGAHRFYFGKPLSGLLFLLTFGLLGIGWIIDLFAIPTMAQQADRRYQTGAIDYTIAWGALTFAGVFGVHRFYMGKIGTGLIYLVSGGLFGIGIIYDFATLNEQIDERNRHSF